MSFGKHRGFVKCPGWAEMLFNYKTPWQIACVLCLWLSVIMPSHFIWFIQRRPDLHWLDARVLLQSVWMVSSFGIANALLIRKAHREFRESRTQGHRLSPARLLGILLLTLAVAGGLIALPFMGSPIDPWMDPVSYLVFPVVFVWGLLFSVFLRLGYRFGP